MLALCEGFYGKTASVAACTFSSPQIPGVLTHLFFILKDWIGGTSYDVSVVKQSLPEAKMEKNSKAAGSYTMLF